MAAELQRTTAQQVMAQWVAAQGERWVADPHCTFCQGKNQHWFNHWRSGETLNICRDCFVSLSFLQCSNCLGMGTSYDMTQIAARKPLCPNCCRRQPRSGLQ